jgi:Trk K+ transport system NAD-binding subunit
MRVCEELTALRGQAVVVLWAHDADLAERAGRLGARLVDRSSDDDASFERAGIAGAGAFLALTEDDQLNLRLALRARDLNPGIRLVLRQFNRALGRKIEQNLPNCSVISLSSHAAATYAGTAVNNACFYGLQFPDLEGTLVGFTRRSADEAGLAGLTVAEAEERLDARILALDGETVFERDARLAEGSALVAFGCIRPDPFAARLGKRHRWVRPRLRGVLRSVRQTARRVDPIARSAAVTIVALFVAATLYFSALLKLSPLGAMYFVTSTMTTTGYGDISPLTAGPAGELGAMLLMIAGLASSGVFIAILASNFARAQFVALQGLRPVRRRGHIVVCGAGNVGSRVIDCLLKLDQRVVVIEPLPRPEIVEASRYRAFDLLTGDAARDTTLDLCNLEQAEALIALTNSDTLNLEVALGARARNPALPIVMRCQEATFAESVARQFGIDRTYGTAGLAAPVFAGLARAQGVRGRVDFCGREFGLAEQKIDEAFEMPPFEGLVPLCVQRDGEVSLITRLDELRPHDRVLVLVPVWQFRKDGHA